MKKHTENCGDSWPAPPRAWTGLVLFTSIAMATAVTSGCDNGGSDLGEVDDDRVDGCDINDGDGVDPGGPIGGDDPVCSLVDLSCSDQWRRAGGSSGGALLIDLLGVGGEVPGAKLEDGEYYGNGIVKSLPHADNREQRISFTLSDEVGREVTTRIMAKSDQPLTAWNWYTTEFLVNEDRAQLGPQGWMPFTSTEPTVHSDGYYYYQVEYTKQDLENPYAAWITADDEATVEFFVGR